ncbi:type II secretion system protein GspF [Buttiauxella warmboldiae]|uniref:General secretion pathway protein F n=1 Tax=Buttiauxella warmboldiae TaxID=82993 RepID=A0A3N5DPV1_9ENTR|nr:type II secretion system inner membrane protein GspF [Buttiauxella warmboldiae]RPH29617.1 type II secretion system protein GspF [Buttiauxella warmboldiae]
MPQFRYLAVDSTGKRHRGSLQASTSRQVREWLRTQQLSPLQVDEKRGTTLNISVLSFHKTRIPASQLLLFTRQLATLINASLPLERSLKVVAGQCSHKTAAEMIENIRAQVAEGQSFTAALSRWPDCFDNRYRALVASGEKSGNLGVVLTRLAEDSEFRHAMRNKLIQAMVYPLTLTLVALTVIVILLVAVVPQIIDQFTQFQQKLPLSTRILITLSHFMQDMGLFLLTGLLLAVLGIRSLLTRATIRFSFHKKITQVPPIGGLIRDIDAARYLRTLSIMQNSGVPLLEGMQIASESGANLYFRHCMEMATEQVRQGSSLTHALQATHLFPAMMLYMVASGEESGQLGVLMASAAASQESRLQHRIAIALTIFEPVLVIGMSGIVLFIVMSILQPILQLNNMFN